MWEAARGPIQCITITLLETLLKYSVCFPHKGFLCLQLLPSYREADLWVQHWGVPELSVPWWSPWQDSLILFWLSGCCFLLITASVSVVPDLVKNRYRSSSESPPPLSSTTVTRLNPRRGNVFPSFSFNLFSLDPRETDQIEEQKLKRVAGLILWRWHSTNILEILCSAGGLGSCWLWNSTWAELWVSCSIWICWETNSKR